MTQPLNRDQVLAALIRHPDWDSEPAHPKDVWTLLAGETIPGETRELLEARSGEVDQAGTIEAEYRDRGIWVLTCVDDAYPARLRETLGKRAPGLLYGFGPQALLAREGTGVVGSRNIDSFGEETAREAGKVIAQGGNTLVSGGARGVDRISMQAALESDGSAVGVLAHPLSKAAGEGENHELADLGRLTLITPFQPDMGFTVANAMARNKLIYALSYCTLVISADLEAGGSWAGATEALRHRLCRVAVWAGDGAGGGNPALVEKGGVPVTDVRRILDREWLDSEAERLEPRPRLDLEGFGNA